MIPKRELIDLRNEWQLDLAVIEKDYVLGWLLASIAIEPALADTWVFKGGTCLRKCYYETYRFSEDLDFTVAAGGPETPEELLPIFARAADWLREETGIELVFGEKAFERRTNKRGKETTGGKIAFRGPNPPHSLPNIKIDITSDEALLDPPALRPIAHPYTDQPLPVDGVRCHTIVELFAEKLRALAERCRPRDLYDVVHMHRHPDLIGRTGEVVERLAAKCAHAGIEVPTLEAIHASPFRNDIEQQWVSMLGHQLPQPTPTFSSFWDALVDVFGWLAGDLVVPVLERAEEPGLDPTWTAPRAIRPWNYGFPLELVRYAGANRLKVEIDYRAREGRQGPRIVEPYSLRASQAGDVRLMVVNDQGWLRGYRLDRIAGVRGTNESFVPRYVVEF
jgi:predicted nucleotidyltransferase component of viral defense system